MLIRRLIAAASVGAALMMSAGAGRASTPDDAWVRKFADRIADAKLGTLTAATFETHFKGVLDFRESGSDSCGKAFEVSEPWPTLGPSSALLGSDACATPPPFSSLRLTLSSGDAPSVKQLLDGLRKKLGNPTKNYVIPETSSATVAWIDGIRRIIVEYDIRHPEGFIVTVLMSYK